MAEVKHIRTGRYCVFNLHVHLVFVTKCRRGVFTSEILEELGRIFAGICKGFDAELVEFDGEDDHVHLLVNSLKGVSSRLIRKGEYPQLKLKLWGGSLWSPSYFAGSCGGAPISILKQYIENQRTLA